MTDQEFLKAAYDMQDYCTHQICCDCPLGHRNIKTGYRCLVKDMHPIDWGISQDKSGKYEV